MKKTLICAAALVLCLCLAAPALAANTFLFTEKSITLFEGESVQTALRREGVYEGDGEITYASGRESVATISADGLLTAVGKGQTEISASLNRNGKRVGKTQASVKVLRAVRKVTLNTTKLSVYEPDHPAVAELLQEETEYPVLVLPAGKTVTLSATCTPEDASSRAVLYTTTDAGVAKVSNNSLRAVQRGECDLTVASKQNPEVTETFRVLVIQPVKKVQVSGAAKTVAVGGVLQLGALCSPDNASIQDVTWSSSNAAVATVDDYGVVTGVKRGQVTIYATAADGSGVKGACALTVTQSVTDISFTQPELSVVTKRTVQARVQVLPADANDKSVVWSSEDESIATVKNGQVTGVKAGVTNIICTSKSNPNVSAAIPVTVSQLVTKIEFTNSKDELSIRTGENVQLHWTVLPDDATDTSVSFRSQQPKIAAVDANGLVTGLSRGTANIVVTSQDAAKRQQTARVTVIQPVTGVKMKNDLYYVQRGGSSSVRAVVEPSNANNQRVYWSSVDESVATIRSNGTSTGSVYGVSKGETTINAYTEDGGFVASAQIKVGNFNEAVMVEQLEVNANNEIRIVLRNMTSDMTFGNIHYRIECFDMEGNPMVCNTDGESTFFEGDYPFLVLPLERTVHGSFRFRNYVINQQLGAVALTVTSWRDADGYTWSIPESEQFRSLWTRVFLNSPVTTPEDTTMGEGVG